MEFLTDAPKTAEELEQARTQYREMAMTLERATAEAEQLREENRGLASALSEQRELREAETARNQRAEAELRHIVVQKDLFIDTLQRAITAQAVELAEALNEAGVTPE